jgi:hypothetical protein
MNLSDLSTIKKMLMRDLIANDKVVDRLGEDEYRQGVGAGLTMALLKIDRLMESEEEAMVREYEESQDR